MHLLFFVCIVSAVAAQGYECVMLEHKAKVAVVDEWVTIILGPFITLFLCHIIYMYARLKKYKRTPGDVIFSICIINLCEIIIYQITAWQTITGTETPDPYNIFCQVTGTLASLFLDLRYFLNIAYAISPIVFVSARLKGTPQLYRIIIFSLALIVIATLLANVVTDAKMGLDLYGQCYLQIRRFDFSNIVIAFAFALIFALLSMITQWYFRRQIPNVPEAQKKARKFIQFYVSFVNTTQIIQIMMALTDLLNEYNCHYLRADSLSFFIDVNNICSLSLPTAQALVIRIDMQKRAFAKQKGQELNESQNLENSPDGSSSGQSSRSRDGSYVEYLHAQMKSTLVYTVLAGILLTQQYKKQRRAQIVKVPMLEIEDKIDDRKNTNKLAPIRFSQKPSPQSRLSNRPDHLKRTSTKERAQTRIIPRELSISKKMAQLKIYPQLVLDNLETIPGFPIYELKLIEYEPEIFRTFVNRDFPMVDIEYSFDLKSNHQQILKLQGPNSGKSGEFFFFSHDLRLILKTMKEEEKETFLKMISSYSQYLEQNPNSLISKIYGVFKVEKHGGQVTYILMMRNISFGVPREFIDRIYDLKGSQYDREVLNKIPEGVNISSYILKDKDFDKLEKQLNISESNQALLQEQLRADSCFLQEHNLIDYSLLVMKIDWKAYLESLGKTMEEMVPQLNNPLLIIPSTTEPGVYYHMAVIDYLQEWNARKGMEWATKKVIEYSSSESVSVQPADVYGQRFRDKVVYQALFPSQEITNSVEISTFEPTTPLQGQGHQVEDEQFNFTQPSQEQSQIIS